MWVSRLTSGDARWVRSPRPVSVTAWTVCPASRSMGTTNLFQDQAPPHAPWTITNVAIASPNVCTATVTVVAVGGPDKQHVAFAAPGGRNHERFRRTRCAPAYALVRRANADQAD